jgi:hypothetical protein
MLSRVAPLALLAVLTTCDCGGKPSGLTPSGARASCDSDADCALTDVAGCCACCKSAPSAIPKLALAQRNNRCAAADCAACSSSIECAKVEPLTAFAAACRQGTCAAVRK